MFPATGFNGATAIQPWIQSVRVDQDIAVQASMGPRLFSRGYLIAVVMFLALLLWLQWGHGYSAVDTAGPRT